MPSTLHSHPAPGALRVENLTAPSAVCSLDAEHSLRDLKLPKARSGEPYRALAVLVRCGLRPLGWLEVAVPETGVISAGLLRAGVEAQFADVDWWADVAAAEAEPI